MTTASSDLIGVKETAGILRCSRSKVKRGYGPEPVMRFGLMRERLFRRADVWQFLAEKMDAPPLPWEWLEVRSHTGTSGWIPRWVAEAEGVNCSQFDRPERERAGIWFNREQSDRIHASPWWRTPEQFELGDPTTASDGPSHPVVTDP